MRAAIAAAVLLQLPAAGNCKVQCKSCRGPQHSWETLPVSWHSSKKATDEYGGFAPEELDAIAKFPLVTIEKWQGQDAPTFLWEEDAMIYAAKQIKEKSPTTSVVVWFDSVRIYTGWTYPPVHGHPVNTTLNPDAGVSCTTGHFRPAEFLETHPDYLLMNTSGLATADGWSGCHIYNFGDEKVRQFWQQMCINMTSSGVIDGCGADASWQNSSKWGLDDATSQAWDVGHRQMMRETTEALGDGLLVGKMPTELGDFVNGVLHESCDASNGTINTLRDLGMRAEAMQKRLVYQCHSKHPDENEIAAFLIGASKDQYYATGLWSDAEDIAKHWLPEFFEPSLGEPLSNGRYNARTGIWSRAFKSGTRVVFDTRTNTGKIRWASQAAAAPDSDELFV